MIRLTFDSRLLASAALGVILLGTAPASAQEAADPAAAAAAAGKPAIGAYGFDAKGMDRTVLPGNDFYAYANGAWAKATAIPADKRSEEHTSELQSLMRNSYAVFCL